MTSTKTYSKEQYEEDQARLLLKALGIKHKFIRHGNDKDEPDTLFRTQKVIGIEVATAYHEDSAAKAVWMLRRGEKEPSVRGNKLFERVLENPDQLICSRIQRELDDKASKKYEGADEFWLCIVEQNPISGIEDVTKCAESLSVPDGVAFTKIYILHHAPEEEGGGYLAVPIKLPHD